MVKFLAVCLVLCVATALGNPFAEIKRMAERNSTLMAIIEAEAAKNVKLLKEIEQKVQPLRACPPVNKNPPAQNIRALHPYDIGAIGAIGDSISQGCNARSTSLINHINYVGLTWDIGGDSGVTTLYNLLTPYAGPIPAPSKGQGTTDLGLNAAKDGAVSADMPTQAADLVNKFKTGTTYPPGQNYATAWKVATILIGGNNFCKVCNDREANSVARYVTAMKQTFDVFKEVPRLFVNVLPMLDIGPLADFRSGIACDLALNQVCPCVMNANGRAVITDFTRQYNAALADLVKSYPVTDDFAIVIQPFLTNTRIPDRSYISTADCFHPSVLGQQSFAIALWNNMLTPAAQKATSFTPGEQPICPTDQTLFYVN